ncbi:hypothetical protein EN933_03700 [Mesorhizobium sp. M7A.F.Ca.US.001.01.1.1]|nr:hypothetical protein EN933_03700 [Mesorhizobium sp. M7A.F.Ca.US.001.01.1.1]
MKLWIWSDLHLEMQNPVYVDKAPEADVIVCAGDLCLADTLRDHAQRLIERYELPMIFVPGNHEFYSNRGVWPPRTKPSDHLLMKEVAEASRSWRNRLYVLDDDILELGGVRFIGGTLWTDFKMDLVNDAGLSRRMQLALSTLADFSRIWLGDGDLLSPQVMLGFHLLTRGDILVREAGVNSKPMLRAGSGDPSDPVEILLDDLMDTPADGCSYGRARPVRLLVCRRGLATR